MTQQKKPNKTLYVCLILALIATSIFVAIISGAGKRSKIDELPLETDMGNQTETPHVTSHDDVDHDVPETSHKNSKDDAVAESDEEAIPTAVSIDEISFTLPLDGAVIVPCSTSTPIYSITMNDYRTHSGVDIESSVGCNVLSCADGVISDISDDPMMGRCMTVTHAEGIESVYKNLSAESPEGIEVGKTVAAGDIIGVVGETALTECESEPHLHFELKVNSKPIDPCEYLSLSSANTEYEG